MPNDVPHFLHLPHHDGSTRYVASEAPELGERVPVFLEVPHGCGADGVWVRVVTDGEPSFVEASEDRRTSHAVWWRADVEVRNPVTRYRFLLTNRRRYWWFTAAGAVAHDIPDDTDFQLVAHAAPPAWARDAVVYQIFPDRFARSAAAHGRPVPSWAVPAAWDDPVVPHPPVVSRQLYGGDLDGIVEHLDHVAELGADTIYVTPFFPAGSSHRYDAEAFDEVDPLLGGNAALERLSREVHRRGWRLLGDITTNHTGVAHPWFRRAADPDSVEHGFYYFDDDGGYASWFDVPSLPKLNHGSAALHSRLLDGPDSVVGRWLAAPYELDGWRVDVANMTGRHGLHDLAHDVARSMRATVAGVRPDGLLIAEHGHDATGDLAGDGWHGTMNYAGFTRPVWTWLRHPDVQLPFLGLPTDVPRWGGDHAVATMRSFAARMPWRSYAHSWSLLGSHDTARIRTLVRDPEVGAVAAGLLFTLPGVPLIFAGDEIGMEGTFGEDGRRPMPWHRPDLWDVATFTRYRSLAALRRSRPALRHGGLRWVYAAHDSVAYLRESDEERLLVVANRTTCISPRVPAGALGLAGEAEPVYGDAKPLVSDARGEVRIPGDGPGLYVWTL